MTYTFSSNDNTLASNTESGGVSDVFVDNLNLNEESEEELEEESEGEFDCNDSNAIDENDNEGFDGAIGFEGADADGVRFGEETDVEERNEENAGGFVQNSNNFDMRPVEDNSVGFFLPMNGHEKVYSQSD